MNIISAEFCHLASVQSFQTWLSGINYDLYLELIEHLHTGQGCASNRNKMVGILKKLLDDRVSKQHLRTYLKTNYPHMISDDNPPVVKTNYNSQNKHGVFDHYDPTLMTFPRRLIVTDLDANQNNRSLDRFVTEFCWKHAKSEHVIVDDRAYIEFIPIENVDLANKVPDDMWQVIRYKNRNG